MDFSSLTPILFWVIVAIFLPTCLKDHLACTLFHHFHVELRLQHLQWILLDQTPSLSWCPSPSLSTLSLWCKLLSVHSCYVVMCITLDTERKYLDCSRSRSGMCSVNVFRELMHFRMRLRTYICFFKILILHQYLHFRVY